jgi:hypothetical protein
VLLAAAHTGYRNAVLRQSATVWQEYFLRQMGDAKLLCRSHAVCTKATQLSWQHTQPMLTLFTDPVHVTSLYFCNIT